MKMLNIGCGACHHPAWINLDLEPRSSDVMALDASQGLPFESNSVDVCYSSHVLEHLRPAEADDFVAQQHRVLKPGGVIRVVVPDLECICRLYIAYLDELASGDHRHEFEYDYTLLELFDQTTRDQIGGELRRTWERLSPEQLAYALTRHGGEVTSFLNKRAGECAAGAMADAPRKRTLAKVVRRGRTMATRAAVTLLLGRRGAQALQEGLVRNSGEIHRVMYDRYRLARLLTRHGFEQIAVCAPDESRIPQFAEYGLDTVGGNVRKPDSLFVEAVKSK